MVTNHASITGPNSLPTRAVPQRWIANRPHSTTTVMGTTKGSSAPVATLSPSTALSTEIAGVMIPSP